MDAVGNGADGTDPEQGKDHRSRGPERDVRLSRSYENGGAIIPHEEEKLLCRLPDQGRVAFKLHFYVIGEYQ